MRRIYYNKAIYHVYNRGNNKEDVLGLDDYKHDFLSTLKHYQRRFSYRIYALILMSNHFHMLIETSHEHDISKVMHAVMRSFGLLYRKRTKHVGHLWQGRFKCRLVETEEYLQEMLDYIHQNPVKANIVEDANDYIWSSSHLYDGLNNQVLEDYDLLYRYGDS